MVVVAITIILMEMSMLSHKTEDGYVGVSFNIDKTHVLLQLTKEEEQIRMKLTPKETADLIEQLMYAIKQLNP